MLHFSLNDTPYQLPQAWDEVPALLLPAVAPTRLASPDDAGPRVQLLMLLTGVPRPLLSACSRDALRLLTEQLDWIWQQELPGGLLEEFEHAGITYLLPQADLSDVTVAEFALADHHLRQFSLTGEESELLHLLATLCRPQRKTLDVDDPEWDGDRREPYNTHLAMRRATTLAEVPLGIRQLVLAHFLAGLATVHYRYANLYEAPEGSAQEQRQAAAAIEGSPIIDLAYSLADKGVFGDFDATCRQQLYTVLEYLDSKRRLALDN